MSEKTTKSSKRFLSRVHLVLVGDDFSKSELKTVYAEINRFSKRLHNLFVDTVHSDFYVDVYGDLGGSHE